MLTSARRSAEAESAVVLSSASAECARRGVRRDRKVGGDAYARMSAERDVSAERPRPLQSERDAVARGAARKKRGDDARVMRRMPPCVRACVEERHKRERERRDAVQQHEFMANAGVLFSVGTQRTKRAPTIRKTFHR